MSRKSKRFNMNNVMRYKGYWEKNQYSGSFNIRIDSELHREANILSKILDI